MRVWPTGLNNPVSDKCALYKTVIPTICSTAISGTCVKISTTFSYLNFNSPFLTATFFFKYKLTLAWIVSKVFRYSGSQQATAFDQFLIYMRLKPKYQLGD